MCRENIPVGIGGEANFALHKTSKRHAQMATNAASNQSIKSFFSKAPTAAQVAIDTGTSLSSSLVHATAFAGPSMSPPVPSATAPQSGSVLIPCTSSQQSFPAKSAFFAKLEVAISTLPVTVLIGTKEDDIAQFSGDPIHNLDDGEDPWEMIDKALNRVIGYGKTATEIEKLI